MNRYTLPERATIWPDYSLNHRPDAFSMPVDYVAVVPAPAGALFHFRLSLVSGATRESVRIDMKPQLESMRGVATVEYKDYEYSRTYGPDPFLVRVSPDTTVGAILRIIFDEDRMDRYTFVEPGVGCRHWCVCVLEKLVERRLAHYSVPRMFEDSEIEEHRKYGSAYPMPRIMGSFY